MRNNCPYINHLIAAFSVLLLVLILGACAQQFMPTGGPKDEAPPVLIQANPMPNDVNFSGKKLRLRFNEFIREEKIKEQLIISPAITGEYRTIVRRNEFELILDEDLDSATTYTFNFREGITDITEKNPAEKLIITFSTGPYIDSLQIIGGTIEALTAEVKKDWTVGLYRPHDSLNAYNSRPRYFTKTDSAGRFQITNITPGNYLLYAWNDKNNNLRINALDEIHGFFPDTLTIQNDTNAGAIPLILNNTDTLRLQSARAVGRDFVIRINKSLRDFDLKPVDSTLTMYYKYSNETKELKAYNTFPNIGSDSIQVKMYALDSIGFRIDSTLFVKFNTESRAEKESFEYKTIPAGPAKIKKDQELFIAFTKPMQILPIDSIYIMIDSVFTYYTDKESLEFDKTRTRARIKFDREQLKEGKDLIFVIPDKSLVSVENDTLDRILVSYQLRNPKEHGTIKGSIRGVQDKDFWVQLLNTSNEIVMELKNAREYSFDLVPPGDYKVRVLVDEDKDGFWFKGNGLGLLKPEPVFFYRKQRPEKGENPLLITLRANWEVTDIDIFVTD